MSLRQSLLHQGIAGCAFFSRADTTRAYYRDQAVGVSIWLLGVCPSNAILLQQTIYKHLRRSRLEKILNVFQRIRFQFLRARAAHLPASPSPRNEGLLGQTPSRLLSCGQSWYSRLVKRETSGTGEMGETDDCSRFLELRTLNF